MSYQTSTDYEEDYYAWTQRQAKLLRALHRAGARLPDDLDIDHLAEEIESLGRAELRSITGAIRQLLVQLIRAASEPATQSRDHWRAKATALQADIPGYYAPSMRRLIEMDVIWRNAIRAAETELQEQGFDLGSELPAESPYDVDDMIAETFDFDAALARLSASTSSA